MQTIVVASRKGGAGKTTLSCHLAVEAERVGAGPVALIDTDPMQGLTAWYGARKHSSTPVLLRQGDRLADTLATCEEAGMRYAVIDTPPAINADLDGVLQLADLVLVPVQPSPDDLRAVGSTVQLVRRAGRSMVFVVNRVKPRVRLTAEAAIELSQHGRVSTTYVSDRVAYALAKADGRTAPELDPGSPAAEEVEALWAYVASKVGQARDA